MEKSGSRKIPDECLIGWLRNLLQFTGHTMNTVFIFHCILSLPLYINENVHIGKSAPRLIRASFYYFSRLTPLRAGWVYLH